MRFVRRSGNRFGRQLTCISNVALQTTGAQHVRPNRAVETQPERGPGPASPSRVTSTPRALPPPGPSHPSRHLGADEEARVLVAFSAWRPRRTSQERVPIVPAFPHEEADRGVPAAGSCTLVGEVPSTRSRRVHPHHGIQTTDTPLLVLKSLAQGEFSGLRYQSW